MLTNRFILLSIISLSTSNLNCLDLPKIKEPAFLSSSFFSGDKLNYLWVGIAGLGASTIFCDKLRFSLSSLPLKLQVPCYLLAGLSVTKLAMNIRAKDKLENYKEKFSYCSNHSTSPNSIYNFNAAGENDNSPDRFKSYMDYKNALSQDSSNAYLALAGIYPNAKLHELALAIKNAEKEIYDTIYELLDIYDCSDILKPGQDFLISERDMLISNYAGQKGCNNFQKRVVEMYLIALDHKRRVDIFKEYYHDRFSKIPVVRSVS